MKTLYIYVCVCVCVCVSEEKEIENYTEMLKQQDDLSARRSITFKEASSCRFGCKFQTFQLVLGPNSLNGRVFVCVCVCVCWERSEVCGGER